MIDRAVAAAGAKRTVSTGSAAGPGPAADTGPAPVIRTLADRLTAARRGAFVGRRAERALFAAALAGDGDPFAVLYIYGPGGIGKSALLHQLADDARQAGRHVVQIDGRLTDSSPPAFAATAAAARRSGSVLLIDTFERCQALEIWLCQRFLPSLPADCIVVIASRLPPDPGWRADPAWSAALRIITLRNLEPGDSAALLSSRGVSRGQRAALLAFAGGHPLALSLAAEVATRTPAPAGGPAAGWPPSQPWEPGQDVVGRLLSQLVGELPSGQHRQAVELCAHVEYTTEDLLRSVFGDDAPGLFSWLRGLPFVEAGPQGLYPHDIVRTALETDLRWRDPDSYERMHAAARGYLVGQVSQAAEAESIERTRTLLYIYRRSPLIIEAFCFRDPDGEYAEEYRPGDRPELLALTARGQSAPVPAPAPELIAFWLDRQPEAFRVYRRSSTGEVVAFDALLRLTGPDPDSSRADPVLAAVWEHCDRNGPLRPGECVSVARFRVYHQPEPRLSAVTDYMQLRIVAEWLKPRGQAWTFVAEPEDSVWRAQLERVEHPQVVPPVTAGGVARALFAHDWRRAPLGPFLDRQSAWAMAGADPRDHGEPADYPVLSRPEFDSAIRAALKSLRSDDLERNVLARSRLAGPAADGSRADALREVLAAAIRALSADPKEAKLHRVLDETFLRGTPTQEAAAAMLHLPFSTYRRYLARGTEIISDRLWDAELGAVANGISPPGGE
jgi:hypothetical protein